MRAKLPVRILFAAATAAFACASPAQDAPAPVPAPPPAPSTVEASEARAERLRLARERWERMSPEERDRLRRRFEQWKDLPPEKRQALRRRLEEMGGDRCADVVRSRLDEMRRRSPERIERMRRQGEALRRLEERLVQALPQEKAAKLEALAPEARDRLRRRFARNLVSLGRDVVLRRHATDEERAALAGADPAAKRAAHEALKRRVREEVLGPHREELAALPEAERRAREARLVEERFRAGVEERLPEVREALLRALDDPAPANGRGPGANRDRIEESRERFQKAFGISAEEIGVRWAPFALHRHLRLLPADRREAFLEKARPELRRIAALPAAEREAALKAFLQALK